MRNRLIIVTAIAALALPLGVTAIAADNPDQQKQTTKAHATMIRGVITKIDGKTLTVGTKEVVYTDKTEIVQNGKLYTDELKVGDKISARIQEGVAVRIEVQLKSEHKDKAPADGGVQK